MVARRVALLLAVDFNNRFFMDRIYDAVFSVALYERFVLYRILCRAQDLVALDHSGRTSLLYLLCELMARASRIVDIVRPDSPSPFLALPPPPDFVYVSDDEEM